MFWVAFAIIVLLAPCILSSGQLSTSVSQSFNAPVIVEYQVPLPNHYLAGITSGPDGALWFTGGQANSGNYVGRITTDGIITEYPVGDPAVFLRNIVQGPDSNLWFTNPDSNIGRITLTGAVTNFMLPPGSFGSPFDITTGSDGALWFTELLGNRIGRISTDGQINEFVLPSFVPPFGVRPTAIALGPDHNIWFGEILTDTLGRITPLGVITEFPLPEFGGQITDMTVGPDGALWFTLWGTGSIGRFTMNGDFNSFPVPDGGNPYSITSGADGALWFTDQNKSRVSRITTAGAVTHIPFPTQGGGSLAITSGPDGNIWFVESLDGRIGKVLLPSFDVCIQDDSANGFLKMNSATGDYQIMRCSDGFSLSGTGSVIKKGCTITLRVNGPDRRILARADTCSNKAVASVQYLTQGVFFTLTDRNITNNACTCP
jgi:virginiamycin B lyase